VIVAVSTMRAQMSHTMRSRPPAGGVSCGSGVRKERRRSSLRTQVFNVLLSTAGVCACVHARVCAWCVLQCDSFHTEKYGSTQGPRGAARRWRPSLQDSCAELTNPATWALRAWRPVQARSGQARGGTGCAPLFGLWRVCFPPCLVRPGRRLPRAVQGLSAERLVNLPVCVSSIVGYCTVSTNTEEPSRVMPTKNHPWY